jgi:hypothetical protein
MVLEDRGRDVDRKIAGIRTTSSRLYDSPALAPSAKGLGIVRIYVASVIVRYCGPSKQTVGFICL